MGYNLFYIVRFFLMNVIDKVECPECGQRARKIQRDDNSIFIGCVCGQYEVYDFEKEAKQEQTETSFYLENIIDSDIDTIEKIEPEPKIK